ncbi:uncharacterized protein LOC111915143 isoform X2 [Lactuca sativa]|uniref:uncharacterized protein LOC111915143 isoform X2 n=1 Tax=Lactuca sativa TaxID=4236 RepID=UPI000CD8DE2D|nr:uncharacterized protein LOC111915143 isoform X2 [Lactuca sativa]
MHLLFYIYRTSCNFITGQHKKEIALRYASITEPSTTPNQLSFLVIYCSNALLLAIGVVLGVCDRDCQVDGSLCNHSDQNVPCVINSATEPQNSSNSAEKTRN